MRGFRKVPSCAGETLCQHFKLPTIFFNKLCQSTSFISSTDDARARVTLHSPRLQNGNKPVKVAKNDVGNKGDGAHSAPIFVELFVPGAGVLLVEVHIVLC